MRRLYWKDCVKKEKQSEFLERVKNLYCPGEKEFYIPVTDKKTGKRSKVYVPINDIEGETK